MYPILRRRVAGLPVQCDAMWAMPACKNRTLSTLAGTGVRETSPSRGSARRSSGQDGLVDV